SGSPNQLELVEAIIYKLEDAEVEARKNEVYHCRNASAADVANALSAFITNSLNVYGKGGELPVFQEFERDIVVVPEPVTNKLLLSATPKYFPELMRLIYEIDQEPPQVVIQALIAEVDLSGTEEFGVEIGLQSPVLFSRTVLPANGFLGNGD